MQMVELAGRLEQLIVCPELLPADAHRAATDAMQLGLAAVIVAPVWVQRVATMLRGSGVTICSTVGFPHGTNKATLKAIEATSSIKDGAEDVMVVPYLPNFMRQDIAAARHELLEIARAARATRLEVQIHVVIEAALLARAHPKGVDESFAAACQAIRESGCDGVVTSSGYHPGGEVSPELIAALARSAAGLAVKVVGGFQDAAAAQRLLEAGAQRLCTEHVAQLLRQLQSAR